MCAITRKARRTGLIRLYPVARTLRRDQAFVTCNWVRKLEPEEYQEKYKHVSTDHCTGGTYTYTVWIEKHNSGHRSMETVCRTRGNFPPIAATSTQMCNALGKVCDQGTSTGIPSKQLKSN
jgi:hypothetical protein